MCYWLIWEFHDCSTANFIINYQYLWADSYSYVIWRYRKMMTISWQNQPPRWYFVSKWIFNDILPMCPYMPIEIYSVLLFAKRNDCDERAWIECVTMMFRIKNEYMMRIDSRACCELNLRKWTLVCVWSDWHCLIVLEFTVGLSFVHQVPKLAWSTEPLKILSRTRNFQQPITSV